MADVIWGGGGDEKEAEKQTIVRKKGKE
jgi:hypothetical protein